MPQIEASITVAVSPADVFAVVGNFADAAWVPGTARTEVQGAGVGARRTVTTVDGARIVEELRSYDPSARRYSYAIVEAPMPIRDYLSTVDVTPEGDGSRVRWHATFEAPEDVAEGIRAALDGLFRAAMDGLAARFKR